MKADWLIYATSILFACCYIWFSPGHRASVLVLNLATDESRQGLPLSDNRTIEQIIHLQKQVNDIVVPIQLNNVHSGTIILSINEMQIRADVVSLAYGQANFRLSQPLVADRDYTVRITSSGVSADSPLYIPYAFGKYANLSGIVNQFIDGKQIDTRHGNIAMQFYENP